MGKKARVALVRCSTYEQAAVAAAVARGLDLLGGLGRCVRAGEKIVLKPNVLVGDAPEKLVGPHPLVFRAVAQMAQGITPNLTYGDSPGFGKSAGQMGRAGLAQVAEELGVALADFENGREVHFTDSPFLKQFVLANAVLEADGLISIAKFKTHQLTRITGPIKNQFGCVPGMLKAEYHVRLPNADDFAKMLVCLNLYIRPRLYVVDGIVAMQGNGPRNGDPAALNVLLFSQDPVALEVAMCRIIDLNPKYVSTIKYGHAWGLGTSLAEEIELVGDPLESFVSPSFDVRRGPARIGIPSAFAPMLRNLVSRRPVIDAARCTRCGTCVRLCPAQPKAVDWHDGNHARPPTYKYQRCIRCFCCQELCPERAITVRTPLLGRVLQRG